MRSRATPKLFCPKGTASTVPGGFRFLIVITSLLVRELIRPQVSTLEAAWDAELGAAMAHRGLAVHEEVLLPGLLDELAPER